MKAKHLFLAVLFVFALTACDNDDFQSFENLKTSSPMDAYMEYGGVKSASVHQDITIDLLEEMNEMLAMEGVDYRVVMAEYITAAGSDEVGQTVIAKNVGNKQLNFDFVPGDTRRTWSGSGGNAITYAIDRTGDAVPVYGGLTAAQTDAAIVNGVMTWDALTCSNFNLNRNPDFGTDIGVVAFIYGFGGSPFVFADVQHAGWRDINFSGGILGVTFTFGFTDANGDWTDIDNNGKNDAAFREIYYDPSFNWANDGSTNIDVESVALHEMGHGLSQGHFGKVFNKKDGTVQFAPRAVMNAVYFGPYRDLQGTDTGGHCSIWSNWPQN